MKKASHPAKAAQGRKRSPRKNASPVAPPTDELQQPSGDTLAETVTAPAAPAQPEPAAELSPAELHTKPEPEAAAPPPPPASPSVPAGPRLSVRGLVIAAVALGLLALLGYLIDEALRKATEAKRGKP